MTVANFAFHLTFTLSLLVHHKTCARSSNSIIAPHKNDHLPQRKQQQQQQEQYEHKFLRVQNPKPKLKPSTHKKRNTMMNMNIISDQSEGDEEEIIIEEQNSTNKNAANQFTSYQWTWDHNHRSNPNRVLVVQDASPGPDQVVLSVTSKVNRAYAKRWRFDYLQFTGVGLVEQLNLQRDTGSGTNVASATSGYTFSGSDSWMATFNKPFLLRKLVQAKIDNQNPNHDDCVTGENGTNQTEIDQDTTTTTTTTTMNNNNLNQPVTSSSSSTNTTITPCKLKPHIDSYDIVLFLDSSAIIVQLDYNILNLIQSNKMIATSMSTIINNDVNAVQELPVNPTNNAATINNNNMDVINNNNPNGNNVDVMLWNLNHPETNHYSNIWMEECFQQYISAYSNTTSNTNDNMNANNNKNVIMPQSEVILSKMLMKETLSVNNNDLEQQSHEESIAVNINTNNYNNSNNSNSNNENIINPIPKEMVDGLQGTLIKQDMSYNYYMIDDAGLRQVMPVSHVC